MLLVTDEIWNKPTYEDDETSILDANSWASRMEQKRKDRENAVARITKPNISSQWRVDILDI